MRGIRKVSLEGINELKVNGVSADSRAVKKGEAFVCLRSMQDGGEAYVNEALSRGAVAVITDKSFSLSDNSDKHVSVENVRSAYAKMLSAVYGEPSRGMKMIAVTGTNGKTTVTKMIESVLKADGKRCAVIGTLGASFEGEDTPISTMTTPDPDVLYRLLRSYADRGAEYVVMEASSHALALNKLDGIVFDIGAITNMTAEHLDFHGNMDNYFCAKASLFDLCKKGVFLTDDYYTVEMYGLARCERVSCSVKGAEADYKAENIGYSFENGTIFSVLHRGCSFPLHSAIPAEFTVSNALLAFSVLTELGVRADVIYKGIASLSGVDGRMQRLDVDADFTVLIDFAHTPDAISKILTSVRGIKRRNGRIVTLFGCGGDRDKTKRSLMGAVASHLSDFVIVTSDNSRSEEPSEIIDQIMVGFDKSCPHARIDSRAEAIEYAILNAEKDDMILLLGKGHERYEIGKMGAVPFSEEEIVRAALKKRRNGGENSLC